MKRFMSLWKDEQGQDLIEYTLLLGFVALSAAALLTTIAGDITIIWQSGSSAVAAAK